MKPLILFVLFLSCLQASAQQHYVNKNIEVGMNVHINKCKKGQTSFESMDLYTKTRFPETKIKVDSATGEGIYESFFSPGDFDAKRLPASYGNADYKIATLRAFDDKNGKQKRVVICYTKNKLSMIWIELDKALELKEIEF